MTTLLDRIQSVQVEYESTMLKFTAEFQALIVDKTISLDERWATFIAAPAFLKREEPYIVHFELEQQFGEISWYDDFYVERHNTITAEKIIKMINDNDAERDDAEEFAIAMKEELLTKRLGRFKHDW